MKKLAIFFLLILLYSCNSPQRDFKKISESSDIALINRFMEKYPEHELIPKVLQIRDSLIFGRVKQTNSIDSLYWFVETYPESYYTKLSKLIIDSLVFEDVIKKDAIEPIENFLKKNPYSRFYQQGQNKLKELFLTYLSDYPGDKRSNSVRKSLSEIEYYEVRKEGDIDGYKAFIKKYPKNDFSKKLQSIIKKDNLNVDFAPSKFFGYRLRHPSAADVEEWGTSFGNYYYQKAETKSYNNTKEYSQFLTFSPKTKYYNRIISKVFDNIPYDFDDNANFILANEYKKREPNGRHINDLTPEKVALTELTQLKTIYLSSKVEASIERAKDYGVNGDDLVPFYQLLEETLEFEKLNAQDPQNCKVFIEKYPSFPYNEVIREEVFIQKFWGVNGIDENKIADLVFWLPNNEAEQFYNEVYNTIISISISEKDSIRKVELLNPWIKCSTYKFHSLEEKLFTADLFSEFALLQLKQNNMNNAAVCFLTASAITHTCFMNVRSKYFSEAFDFDAGGDPFGALENMQKRIEKVKQKLQLANKNIDNSRSLLYATGLSSYFFGSSDFLNKVLEGIEAKDEKEVTVLEIAKKEANKIKEQDTEIYKNSILLLTRLFEIDKNCWPALRAFIIYPEIDPLEDIVLMPRFYDYEGNIEEYLNNFENEAVALAKEWLKNSDDIDKVERAYYILGYFKTNDEFTPKVQLADSNKYLCYYNVRIGKEVAANKEKLMKKAAGEDMIALVLYNRVADDDITPSELKNWLYNEIDNKKYTDNEVLHIFYKSIDNLSPTDKSEVIDKMYNSYNMTWGDAASQFYELEIPEKISESYVKNVMEGATPYKKVDLIKYIAKNELTEYSNYVESYLSGKYYTEGDRSIIRRNLENMFTKDIVVGYNQRINYSVVKSAVDKSEKVYKALLIQMAMSGLNILDFDSSVNIIKTRFLTDDNLCVPGSEWILKNYDQNKVTGKPAFLDVIATSDEQKAIKIFLNAYFSENPDYVEYTKLCRKLIDSDKWINLVTLNAQYGNKAVITENSAKIANPIKDWDLSVLNSNIKQRYLDIINR